MKRGLNKFMIIGYVSRDPEMRYTPSGRPVTSFSVAIPHSWTSNDGERREETEWVNVVAWDQLAEICKSHLVKNQQVYVDGRLQTRGWEDDAGKKHYRTELVAATMLMLGDRRASPVEEDLSDDDGGDYAF